MRAARLRYSFRIAVKVAAFTQKISPVKAEKTDFRLKIAKKTNKFYLLTSFTPPLFAYH